jgi:uncharacterized protein (TIGR02646 family)
MICIDRSKYPCPNSLVVEGGKQIKILIKSYTDDPEAYKLKKSEDLFKKDVYASDDVKANLIATQNGKCAFCESTIHEVSYSHVEHYRPKGAWKANHEDKLLKRPGYFKEAYEYGNLLLACAVCNTGNKQNYFPLQYEDVRNIIDEKYDCNTEDPLFINPLETNPEDHIDFYMEVPLGKTLAGSVTIEYFGLDRQALNDKRLEKFNLLLGYQEILKDDPDNKKAKDIFKRQLKDTIENNRTYVAMVISNFKEYLDEN